MSVFALILIGALAFTGFAPMPALAADYQPIFRLYNHKTSEHLYTSNVMEYDQLPLITNGDWVAEGIAWWAPASSKSPVYRLYNPVLGDHHYTMSPQEVDVLCARHGWQREGIAFYSDDEMRVPLHRLYNGRLRKGQHHYTASNKERDTLAGNWGWKKEGTGFYGAATEAKPIYEKVWVVDSEAWDEPTYLTRSYILCSDGTRWATSKEAGDHLFDVLDAGGEMGSYSVQYEQVQTGTIHHEATGHWETRRIPY